MTDRRNQLKGIGIEGVAGHGGIIPGQWPEIVNPAYDAGIDQVIASNPADEAPAGVRPAPLGIVPPLAKELIQLVMAAVPLGRLAGMQVCRRSDGTEVTLLIVTSYDAATGDFDVHPVAEIISGNLYELYDPEVEGSNISIKEV